MAMSDAQLARRKAWLEDQLRRVDAEIAVRAGVSPDAPDQPTKPRKRTRK